MDYLRLRIEPIPAGSRLASLARLMPRSLWNRIRRAAYRRAAYRCKICGRRSRLDCHEVWQFNERTGYQWLRGFQALCRSCHSVKHLFFVHDSRKQAKLLHHFMTVNRISPEQVEKYLRMARKRQLRLDRRKWIVIYGDYNWRMPPLKTVEQRRNYLGSGSHIQRRRTKTQALLNQEPLEPRTNARRLNQASSG